MKKKAIITCIVLVAVIVVLLCLWGKAKNSGMSDIFDSGNVIYTNEDAGNKIYNTEGTDTVTLYLYHQYGYEMYIDSKKITGEAATVIKELIKNLSETTDVEEKISDEEVDLDYKHGVSISANSGTMWVKTEDALYRIASDDSRIARVTKPLGEGVVLDFTDTCKSEINSAWSYWPRDCWYGVYEDNVLTMEHRYVADTNVSVKVKNIKVSGKNNSIKLELLSDTTQEVEVDWETSNGGDWYGSIDSEMISLQEGKKQVIELDFAQVGDTNKYGYYLTIRVENTYIKIDIPGES